MTAGEKSARESGLEEKARWRAVIARYQRPSTPRALWQIINTLVPYVGLWCLMYWLKDISLWLTIPFAVVAGGLLVRDIHHLSRLRARFVFQVALGQ